jgi:hypothetical protein
VAQAYIADRQRAGWRTYQSIYPKSSQPAAAVAWSRRLTDADFSYGLGALQAQAAQGAVMSSIAFPPTRLGCRGNAL